MMGFGADLRRFERCKSTQDEARLAASQGAQEGCVILADAQDAGRGRWGRRWEDAPGKSLLFTVLLDAKALQPATLPLYLGLATVVALRGLGLGQAGVKWPNDLWVGGRKLGGLLLETHGPWVLAGCGLNVGQAAEDLPPELRASATSLSLEGLPVGRDAVLAAVLQAWEGGLESWKKGGFGPFLARFEAVDALKGLDCDVRSGGQVLQGRYLGVDPSGALRLGLPGGEERRLQSAEIEQVRPSSPD